VTSSREVATMVRTIAATADEQAKATNEISSAVSDIARITDQFSSSTSETSEATRQLSQKSEILHQLVEKVMIERRTSITQRQEARGATSSRGSVVDISSVGALLEFETGTEPGKSARIRLRSEGNSADVGIEPRWKKNVNGKSQVGVKFQNATSGLAALVSTARDPVSRVKRPKAS